MNFFYLERRHSIQQSKSVGQQESPRVHVLNNERVGKLTQALLVTFGSILKQRGYIVKIVAARKFHQGIVLHVAAIASNGRR